MSEPVGRDGATSSQDVICAALESAPVDERVPVDVLILMDGTASTGRVPLLVREAVGEQLRSSLDDAGIDYRVILVSGCGFDLDGLPPGRYVRYPLGLGSGDALAFAPLLRSYAARQWDSLTESERRDLSPCVPEAERWRGWRELIREESTKVLLHFTDSQGSGETIDGFGETFERELSALDPSSFGPPDGLRLHYHAFVGISAPADTAARRYWCPDEPVVTTTCSSDFAAPPGPGVGFQGIARRTGGYRVSICDFANYEAAFTRIAQQAISAGLACSFDIPPPVDGRPVDLDAVDVRWHSEGGATVDLRRVPTREACDAESFVVSGGETPRVELCTSACVRLRRGLCDESAGRLSVRFLCEPRLF